MSVFKFPIPVKLVPQNKLTMSIHSNPSQCINFFEKCDLVLRSLYYNWPDDKQYSIRYILENSGLKDRNREYERIAKKLKKDGLITGICTEFDSFAELTLMGLDFCLKDSYSEAGKSLLNLCLIKQMQDRKKVTRDIKDLDPDKLPAIRRIIQKIRISLGEDAMLQEKIKKELLQSLEEVENNVDVCKTPVFSFNYLEQFSSSSKAVSSLVKEMKALLFTSFTIQPHTKRKPLISLADLEFSI